MLTLTETIQKDVESEQGFGEKLVDDTAEFLRTNPRFMVLFKKIPEYGIRDSNDCLLRRNGTHLELSAQFYDCPEEVRQFKKIKADVFLKFVPSNEGVKVAGYVDKNYESSIFMYDLANGERFIKNYSNGSYKTKSALEKELKSELISRGWL